MREEEILVRKGESPVQMLHVLQSTGWLVMNCINRLPYNCSHCPVFQRGLHLPVIAILLPVVKVLLFIMNLNNFLKQNWNPNPVIICASSSTDLGNKDQLGCIELVLS